MQKKYRLLYVVVCLLLCLTSCSQAKVKLCEYSSLPIPTDLTEISEEDISFSLRMKLQESMVTIPKQENAMLVEEDDIVTLLVSEEEVTPYELVCMVGDEVFSEEFTLYLIGKEKGEFYFFSQEDTNISFQITDIAWLAEEMTDEIAQVYFNCASEDALRELTRQEIVDHRIFEYRYETLLNQSLLRTYIPERDAYVNSVMAEINTLSEEHGESAEEFVAEEYGVTLSDLRYGAKCFYDEYLILEALMQNEGIDISEEAFVQYITSIADEWGTTVEEVRTQNHDIELRYSMYFEHSFDLLRKVE